MKRLCHKKTKKVMNRFFAAEEQKDLQNQKYTVADFDKDPRTAFQTIISERKPELIELFDKVKSTKGSYEKGNIFETFAIKLFNSPFLVYYDRNVSNTGEIDVVFETKKIPGTIFESFNTVLLIECKNWLVKKVDKKEISDFSLKLSKAESNVGILFSRGEITKNATEEIHNVRLLNKTIIIVITSTEIEKVLFEGQNLYDILKKKYMDARLS